MKVPANAAWIDMALMAESAEIHAENQASKRVMRRQRRR